MTPADTPDQDEKQKQWEAEQEARFYKAQEERRKAQVRHVDALNEARKKPGWWDRLEREVGERIVLVQLASGRTIDYRRFEPEHRRRIRYNWRIAAQVLARGEDVFAAAYAVGCPVETVERRLRDGSRLARLVEDLRRRRFEQSALRTEAEGEIYVRGIHDYMKPDTDRGDRPFHRWLVKWMAAAAPPPAAKPLKRQRKSAQKPAAAASGAATKPAPVSEIQPPLAETGPGKPEPAPVSRIQRP